MQSSWKPTLRYRRPRDIKRKQTRRHFEWRRRECWHFLLHRRRTSKEVLIFLRRFRGFIGFHACRPLDVRPYYFKGLELADHEQLTAHARRIFVTPEFPEISEEEFDLVTSKISKIDHA